MTVTTGSERRPSGIPTTYRETRFRSRLEARWAAFFDLVGWSWTYEPFDADDWIPDFLIHGPAAFLVEVGPCVDPDDYLHKATKPGDHADRPTLVLGVSPLALPEHLQAGLIVNEFPVTIGPAFWMWCTECSPSSLTIYGDLVDRPCGHNSARPNNLGHYLHDLWASAGNKVQWLRR